MKKSRIAQFKINYFKYNVSYWNNYLFFLPTLFDTFSGLQETTFNEQKFIIE
jgi:hypothetical protein